MAVNVYFPLGIPINIKVTQDTPILQILNEACNKRNVDPDEYDLKYHNKILDVNSTIRYVQIANNAKLDLVKRNVPRAASKIRVCVQLENRDRKNGEFPSDVYIKQVLSDLNVEYNPETAVIIFTQREIFSKDFETVTLLSLGLGAGSALFRLLHRDPERPREQAHVYVPPTPKVSKLEEEEDWEPKTAPTPKLTKNNIFDPISAIKAEKDIQPKQNEQQAQNEEQSKSESKQKVTKDPFVKNVIESEREEKEEPMEVEAENEEKTPVKEEPAEEPQIYYLDEDRQALLFNQAGAQAMPQVEIPDDFFDVTIKDIRLLQIDMQKLNERMKESPLMTEKLRNLEKEKNVLTTIYKYTKAVIRIYFPNQLVLQGIFKPVESVQVIKDFVESYLEHPDSEFTLYTTPPPCNLNVEKSLLDENLVPSAKIYYSGNSDLKPDVKSKMTDPLAASLAATKTRLTTTRNNDSLLDDTADAGPSQSQSQQQSTSRLIQPTQKSSSDKIPKWFKPSK